MEVMAVDCKAVHPPHIFVSQRSTELADPLLVQVVARRLHAVELECETRFINVSSCDLLVVEIDRQGAENRMRVGRGHHQSPARSGSRCGREVVLKDSHCLSKHCPADAELLEEVTL